MNDTANRIIDVVSSILQWLVHAVLGGALLGALVGILPFIFGLPACVYYLILIYEKHFFQNWLRRRRKNKTEKLRLELERLQRLDNL